MKQRIEISIGITAYNEEANIKKLLKSILSQRHKNFNLLEVILVSDGSTDKTVSEAFSIFDKRIKIFEYIHRVGKSQRINNILNEFRGDYLFLLDADIKISDKNLFDGILKNVDHSNVGLFSISVLPNKNLTSFQKIVNVGFSISTYIAKNWNNGRNYLSFKGCFLGLSRNFAKNIRLNQSIVNNDAFIYFMAKTLGYSSILYSEKSISIKLPENLTDYIGQSKRYIKSQNELESIFDIDLNREYLIPRFLYIKSFIYSFIHNPIYYIAYLVLKIYALLIRKNEIKSTWNIAVSTKQI